jgi:RNA-splicing ligase RtcB
MDELKEAMESSKSVESTVKITRKEFEDGSSEEQKVEQVEGGYIITAEKRFKDKEGCWQYKTERSVSTEDPTMDKSTEGIASRLEALLKNMD